MALGDSASLEGGGEDSRSKWLAEDQVVSDAGAPVVPDTVGVDGAGDGQSVFQLVVGDGVSAPNHCPGLVHDVVASPKDFSEYFGGEVLVWESDNVHYQGGSLVAACLVLVSETGSALSSAVAAPPPSETSGSAG